MKKPGEKGGQGWNGTQTGKRTGERGRGGLRGNGGGRREEGDYARRGKRNTGIRGSEGGEKKKLVGNLTAVAGGTYAGRAEQLGHEGPKPAGEAMCWRSRGSAGGCRIARGPGAWGVKFIAGKPVKSKGDNGKLVGKKLSGKATKAYIWGWDGIFVNGLRDPRETEVRWKPRRLDRS